MRINECVNNQANYDCKAMDTLVKLTTLSAEQEPNNNESIRQEN